MRVVLLKVDDRKGNYFLVSIDDRCITYEQAVINAVAIAKAQKIKGDIIDCGWTAEFEQNNTSVVGAMCVAQQPLYLIPVKD